MISQLGKDAAKTLQGLPQTVLILGGWVNQQSTWEGSVKDFTRIISDSGDPGGGGLIDSQLGKGSVQRLCKDYLMTVMILGGQSTVNLGRIHEDFARITYRLC